MADLGDFTAAVREHERASRGIPDTFRFFDVPFAVTDEMSPLPLMKFAAAAEAGLETEEMEGLAACYEFIRSCLTIAPVIDNESGVVIAHGWVRFERVCVENRVSTEELLTLCTMLIEVVTGRPTERPSSSQDGPSTATPSLKLISDRARTPEADWDTRMRVLGMVPALELAAELGSLPG